MSKVRRSIFLFGLGTGFVLGSGLIIGLWHFNSEPEPSVLEQAFPPCVSEDAPNAPCFWDASTQGNGEGTSFIALANNTTVWLTPDGSVDSIAVID